MRGRLAVGSGRVWTNASVVLVTVGILLVAGPLTLWMLATGERGAEIANVLAFPMSVVGIGLSVLGLTLRAPGSSDTILVRYARRTALAVAEQESSLLMRLLNDTGDAEPADIGLVKANIVQWRTDGGRARGRLGNIAGYYRSLKRGRLVVLGQAGSGKTVLLAKLAFDLAVAATDALTTGTFDESQPVPLRVSLPSVDLGPSPHDWTGSRLDGWLADYLVNVFGVPRTTAVALVRRRWIMPIFDGLDEMDPEDEPPSRAMNALTALNAATATGPRRLVVACRSGRYSVIANTPPLTGQTQALQDATAVTIEPMSVKQVIAYLSRRFPDSSTRAREPARWKPVFDHLRTEPDGPLATTLRSPLMLFLAITAHTSPDSDTTLLIKAGVDLEDHLLRQFVPAVVAHRPPTRRPGTAAQVDRWLRTLADQLRWQQERGLSPVDLDVVRLWHDGNWWPARLLAAWVEAILVAVLLTPVIVIYHTHSTPFASRTISGLAAAATVLTLLRGLRPANDRSGLSMAALRTPYGRRAFAVRCLLGGLTGVATGMIINLGSALLVGVAFALVFGVAFGLRREPVAAPRPSSLANQVRLRCWLTALTFGYAFGLTIGLAATLTMSGGMALVIGVMVGLASAILVVADSPWPHHIATAVLLARTNRLPPRPAAFLDWTYDVGIVRMSTVNVQFRHERFQRWLATGGASRPPSPSLIE